MGFRFALDIGAGFNLIWRNLLPVDWEEVIDQTSQEPKLKMPM